MLIYLYAILIGVFSYVFKEVLIQDGEILGFYNKLLEKINNDYIRKPLGGCLQCLSGQLSLWSSLYLGLRPFDIVLFITLTIFTTIIIEKKLW